MSSIVIKGNTSGQIELAAPDVAGSTTLTLPTGTGTVLLSDGDGSNLTNLPQPAALSTATGSAPSYSARMWVIFDGSGAITIRASANVSSITDSGVGLYYINFATNMPDTNYNVVGSISESGVGGNGLISLGDGRSVDKVFVITKNTSGTVIDWLFINVVLFR